jgi:hypothetical protein
MPTSVYIFCPSGEEGASRGVLEDELEEFFGAAAELSGGGGGVKGFNIDFELADGEDVDEWVSRLRQFLVQLRVRRGTRIQVFPDGWEHGMSWRRVEVFGSDQWVT